MHKFMKPSFIGSYIFFKFIKIRVFIVKIVINKWVDVISIRKHVVKLKNIVRSIWCIQININTTHEEFNEYLIILIVIELESWEKTIESQWMNWFIDKALHIMRVKSQNQWWKRLLDLAIRAFFLWSIERILKKTLERI